VALRKVQHKYYNKVQKLSTSSTNMWCCEKSYG
jgi:hypothetical protein